jgi:twinkle protein
MDAAEVRQRLQQRAEDVIRFLYPNVKKSGSKMLLGNIHGDPGSSLEISLQRGKEGLFIDRANPDDKGDIFSLWMNAKGISFKEALAEAKGYLGITEVKPAFVKQKPPRPPIKDVKPVYETPAEKHLIETRKLTREVLKKYKVCYHGKGELRPHEGQFKHNEHFIIYSYRDTANDVVMFKSTGIHRTEDGKKDIWTTKPYYTLWGWWTVDDNTREITICEGEEDSMSAVIMGAEHPVLSLPSGVSNLNWIDNDFERLQQFETIYLLIDGDEAGEKGAQEIARRLGRERCKRVKIPAPYKDANEYLVKCGDHGKFLKNFKESVTYDPPTLQASDRYARRLREQIETMEKERNEPPNFFMPNVPFRFRRGELTLITGYPFHGKSQAVYQAMMHEMEHNGKRVCVASYEIPAEQMLMNMTWMRKEKFPTADQAEEELPWFGDKLWFIEPHDIEHYGPDGLLNDFLYSIKRFGCDIVVVDALMHVIPKTDFEGQERFAKQLARFAVVNEVSVVLIAHADAKKQGSERVPEQEDVLGGQGIGAAAHNGMSIWRNKGKEKALARGESVKRKGKNGAPDELWIDDPDGVAYLWKQRLTGVMAYQDFMFCSDTRKMREYHKA